MSEPSGEKPPGGEKGEEGKEGLFAVLNLSHFEEGCGPGKTRPPWTLNYAWQWTYSKWPGAAKKKLWEEGVKEVFIGNGRVDMGEKQGNIEVEIYARRKPRRPLARKNPFEEFDFVVYQKRQSLKSSGEEDTERV